MNKDPYKILNINKNATLKEIKSAYIKLVKIHHPDTGGDEKLMLEINNAWEKLKNQNESINRKKDFYSYDSKEPTFHTNKSGVNSKDIDQEVRDWIEYIYVPIDKLLGQIINPFNKKIRELSADPYDDQLMDSFCEYIENSKKKMEKINKIYTSKSTPLTTKTFSLNLYHCLSQVQDSLQELERYTMGYVDNYLHDGKQMLIEAKKKRQQLKNEHKK